MLLAQPSSAEQGYRCETMSLRHRRILVVIDEVGVEIKIGTKKRNIWNVYL